MKDLNLIITGVGGQGNVVASQIVGNAAVNRDLKVTIGETFGLSQRGGAVMSHIRLSHVRRYGPLIPPNRADLIIGLEPLETLRILPDYGNADTIFIVNSRPIYPLNVIAGDVEYPDPEKIKSILGACGKKLHWLDATSMALDLGGAIYLNMIMLGALCSIDQFPLNIEDMRNAVTDLFPENRQEDNDRALFIGQSLIKTDEN
ncbi:indolepyruvate oxidoreductase subunit beta [Thermodesulfobacteriota bacterium]